MKLILVALVPWVFLISCTAEQSEDCQEVCRQETECAAKRKQAGEDFPYDLDECVKACITLERDKASQQAVKDHVKCAREAKAVSYTHLTLPTTPYV